MNLRDSLNAEYDGRKLKELDIDVSDAIILSVSECCGADMIGERDNPVTRCSKCHKVCEGAEE